MDRDTARELHCIKYTKEEPCSVCGTFVRFVKSNKCVECRHRVANKHYDGNKKVIKKKHKQRRDNNKEARKEEKARSKLKKLSRERYAEVKTIILTRKLTDLDAYITDLKASISGEETQCQLKDVKCLIEKLEQANTQEYRDGRLKQLECSELPYGEYLFSNKKQQGNLPIVRMCPFCNKKITRIAWARKHRCSRRVNFEKSLEISMSLPTDF